MDARYAIVGVIGLTIAAGAAILVSEDRGVGDPRDGSEYTGIPHIGGLGNTSLPLLATTVDEESRLLADPQGEGGPVAYCGASALPTESEPLRFTAIEPSTPERTPSFVDGPEGDPVHVADIDRGNWTYAHWGQPSTDDPMVFVVADRGLEHDLATEGIIAFAALSPYRCANVDIPEPDDPVAAGVAPTSVNLTAIAFDRAHFGHWFLDGVTTDSIDGLPGVDGRS
jgi:hypothetical protein